MNTLHLPNREKLTHLQRAYRVFVRMKGHLLSGRALAALLQCEVQTAYNYIKRLKEAGCIERAGGKGKVPTYRLCDGAEMPPGDRRGGKRARAAVDVDEQAELELIGSTGQ